MSLSSTPVDSLTRAVSFHENAAGGGASAVVRSPLGTNLDPKVPSETDEKSNKKEQPGGEEKEKPKPKPPQQQPQQQQAPQAVEGSASTFEVLVVDDADSNRKMLTMLLKRKGLVSHTAENGQIAVDMVVEDLHRYKLVLMDNLMPVMNGVDAAKAMRAAGYPYLIAGITGNVMEDDIDEYLGAGADLVISKPLKRTTLDLLVKHIDDTGPLSRPGYRLLEQVEAFEWLPKKLQ